MIRLLRASAESAGPFRVLWFRCHGAAAGSRALVDDGGAEKRGVGGSIKHCMSSAIDCFFNDWRSMLGLDGARPLYIATDERNRSWFAPVLAAFPRARFAEDLAAVWKPGLLAGGSRGCSWAAELIAT